MKGEDREGEERALSLGISDKNNPPASTSRAGIVHVILRNSVRVAGVMDPAQGLPPADRGAHNLHR
jgi:hypothetical protein